VSFKSSKRSWSSQGRDGLPASLQQTQELRKEFDGARDPYSNMQREDKRKAEARSREEQGTGSQMVKLHKPFPELRPKSAIAQQSIRHSFNTRWHAEHMRASRRREHKDAFDHVDQLKSERGLKPGRTLERQ
jgi:hypothetical protein